MHRNFPRGREAHSHEHMATSTPTLEEFLNREVVTLSSVRQNLVAAIDLQMRS